MAFPFMPSPNLHTEHPGVPQKFDRGHHNTGGFMPTEHRPSVRLTIHILRYAHRVIRTGIGFTLLPPSAIKTHLRDAIAHRLDVLAIERDTYKLDGICV